MMRITRGEFVHFVRLYLFQTEIGRLARVQTYVLLQHECVRELLMTNGTLVKHSKLWLRTVHTHVGFEVALRGKSSPADFTLERTFSCMRSIMHLQGALAREYSVTNDALIWIGQLVLDIIDQLLQFRSFRRFRYFDQTLPRIVVASGSW